MKKTGACLLVILNPNAKFEITSATKPVVAKLKAPSVKAASAGITSIKVSWKKVEPTTKTSFTNQKLKKNKTYYYKVRAYKKTSKDTVYRNDPRLYPQRQR